jgi:hypothetical protein
VALDRRAVTATRANWLVGGLGVLILALVVADVPLAGLAHQPVDASGGSAPVWISAGCGIVGLVLAWRKPGNAIGWVLVGVAVFGVLSQDASFYSVAVYRLRHGHLPLGWLALLAQPGWAPTIALLGVVVLLFPDGRPPWPRLRWVLWAYLGVAVLWIASAMTITIGAIASHRTGVDASGNLRLLGSGSSTGWWGLVSNIFFLLLAGCWLLSLGGQVLSYRRSTGERRSQLKWLVAGTAGAAAGMVLTFSRPNGPAVSLRIVGDVTIAAAFLALPASIAVAVLKYRLYDIDRIISRTLAYAIVTGLLIGVYAGLVLLATQVLGHGAPPVVVAGATLVAAALFYPLRRRVQRAVDRRFNRARYDADRTIEAFAARLAGAVDYDDVNADLLGTVQRALEPAGIWAWRADGGSRSER